MEPLAALPNLPHFRANKARPRGKGGDFEFTDGTNFFEQVNLSYASYTTHIHMFRHDEDHIFVTTMVIRTSYRGCERGNPQRHRVLAT